MGLNVIYSDARFTMYDPETYADFESVCDLNQSIWDAWKQEYKYIYLVSDKTTNGMYLYVPDNDTFKYKATPKDGDGDVGNFEVRDLATFQKDNAEIGLFIEGLTYDVIVNIENFCVVKREELTTERKTYVMLHTDKDYVYTALAPKMNKKMINLFKEHLDVCRQVEEYINADVLAQIYG